MTEVAAKYITAAVKVLRTGVCSQSCCPSCDWKEGAAAATAEALSQWRRTVAVTPALVAAMHRTLQEHSGSLGSVILMLDFF